MRVDQILMLKVDPRDAADELATSVYSLLRVARLALMNGDEKNLRQLNEYVADVLEIAEALMDTVAEGADELAREAKRGWWSEEQQKLRQQSGE